MNKLKKVFSLFLATLMVMGIIIPSATKVDAIEKYPIETAVNMTSCSVIPVGPQVSTTQNTNGDYELTYDTAVDKYNLTYDAVMDVTQMWAKYDELVNRMGAYSNYIQIEGDFNGSLSFDPKLDVDASKFSVEALNQAFKLANPTMWQMYNVTSCNYDSTTRTLAFTVHLNVSSVDFKTLIDSGKRTNTMSVRIPEGALSLAKEDITDGMNITVTGSNFGGDMTLTATGIYSSVGLVANINVKSPIGVSDVVTKVDVVNVPNRYTITTNVTNGTVVSNNSTTDKKTVDEGNNYIVEYQPNDGYVIDTIKVDGVVVDPSTYEKSYSFTNITTNHVVDVVYKKKEVAVTPTNSSTTKKTSSVKTGDNTQYILYIMLLAGSLVCFELMNYSRKKHNK
ncbi:MAG: hypothetical protein PHH04_00055 [Thomasclavelia sp.]|nr:hypothetical protein [Thomasclavelia sp.]